MGQNRHLGDQRYNHLLALIAQAAGQGSPFQVATSFVWRPGGVPYRNVFVDWPSLYRAIKATPAGTVIFVAIDSSLATCHITTSGGGAWDINNFRFSNIVPISAQETIIIDDGAVLVFNNLETRAIRLENHSTTSPVTAGTQTSFRQYNGTSLSVPGAAPFVHAPTGSAFGLHLYENGSIGGHNSFLQSDAGATVTIEAYDVTAVAASTLSGTGAIDVQASAGATISTTQPGLTGLLTISYKAFAPQVQYTPADATKWVGPAPTTVQQALDRIAANTTNTHPIP